jgi:3'-phosphoadenosine 5'-phosphosulfate sulfotransferase (PAPS reductase)/FAD synthetase
MAARRSSTPGQGELFLAEPAWPPAAPVLASGTPDLAFYDLIVANISGGKDSQTMLRRLVQEADSQGYPRSRIVVIFADLGNRDEWLSAREMDARNGTNLVELYGDRPGAAELAEMHAAHYGLRFIVTGRQVAEPLPEIPGEPPERRAWRWRHQDLVEHIWGRNMWPSADARYCTSDSKRGPIRKKVTELVGELRAAGLTHRPARVLNVVGMRAQESITRRLMSAFAFDEGFSSKSRRPRRARRHVWTWLPVHSWTIEEIWADIHASQVPYHWVYDAGLPRLSCRFCILAGRSALVLAAQLDPAGAEERMAVEREFMRRRIVTLLAVASYARACGWPRPLPPAAPQAGTLPVPAEGPLDLIAGRDPAATRQSYLPELLPVRVLRRAWRSGWKFQQARSMHEIAAEARTRTRPEVIDDWAG